MITETLTNPPVGVSTGVGVVATNMFIATLPTVINVIMVVYLIVLVAHKSWQFYQEVKAKRNGNSSK
jgi:hypothetical protein